MLLVGCSSGTQYIDDIDLAYYVHHVNHRVFSSSKKAIVSIKKLKSDIVKEYTFTDLIWSDTYYWMGDCSEYVYVDDVFDFFYCSILHDGIASVFINNNFNDCISAIDYYGDSRDERQEETKFFGHIATLKGSTLTMINQWQVISYTSKTEVHDDAEDSVDYQYEDPKVITCASRLIYDGEKLNSYRIAIIQKSYFQDEDGNGIVDFHEDVIDNPIDYIEYKTTFKS